MKHLEDIIRQIESPHADKIFVGKGYTKADLIRDLRAFLPPTALAGTEASHIPGGITWIDNRLDERFPR